MSRSSASSLPLGIGLLAALALSACTHEEASGPAPESDRSARADADAAERRPVAASEEGGGARDQPARGDASDRIASPDPFDVLDPQQRDVAAPVADTDIAGQAAKGARSEAIARCATLAPRDRSDCESYAMAEFDERLEHDAGADAEDEDALPADEDDL